MLFAIFKVEIIVQLFNCHCFMLYCILCPNSFFSYVTNIFCMCFVFTANYTAVYHYVCRM